MARTDGPDRLVRLTVRIPAALARRLRLACVEGLTQQEVIREALERTLRTRTSRILADLNRERKLR